MRLPCSEAAAQGLGVEPQNVEFMLAVRLELVAQARQPCDGPRSEVIRAGGLASDRRRNPRGTGRRACRLHHRNIAAGC